MENGFVERNAPPYEPKPGFSVAEKPYGTVLTFNFNLEFARRLRNVLSTVNGKTKLRDPLAPFLSEMDFLLELSDTTDEPPEREDYLLNRFKHVFTISCDREFAFELSQLLSNFMVQQQVSPALVCFIKQLQGTLMGLPRYVKPEQARPRYADEF